MDCDHRSVAPPPLEGCSEGASFRVVAETLRHFLPTLPCTAPPPLALGWPRVAGACPCICRLVRHGLFRHASYRYWGAWLADASTTVIRIRSLVLAPTIGCFGNCACRQLAEKQRGFQNVPKWESTPPLHRTTAMRGQHDTSRLAPSATANWSIAGVGAPRHPCYAAANSATALAHPLCSPR